MERLFEARWASLFALLACLWLSAQAMAAERSVRGSIFALQDDGSFQLEDGLVVQRSSTTSIRRGAAPYAGPLLVGLDVEVAGAPDASGNTLLARRVTVLTELEEEVQGTAVLQERRDSPDGLVLFADGRRLLVTPHTRRATSTVETGAEDILPGAFLSYRGRWTPGGVVELTELALRANRLEEKERAIYDAYQPEVLLPKTEGGDLSQLRVGGNRYPLLDDREMQLYVARLGSRLLPSLWHDPEAAKRFGYSLWFLVALYPAPQASAFPSGVVVIHSGLFHLAENEAQLAFAVGHELAHILEEHAWRESAYHQKKLRLLRWSTAGIGYLVESAIRRGYQRELESQADRLALWYMAQAGYDVREGLKFLRRLEERQEGLSALLWEKHKSYGQRRRALRSELVMYSAQGLAYSSLTRSSSDFALIRARIPTARIEAVRRPGPVKR